LHEEVARRMEDRLQWIVQKPVTWLDWEPSRGGSPTAHREAETAKAHRG